MSATIKAAITALKGRIAAAYSAISAKGGTLPATQDSANLASAIATIPSGGGGISLSGYNYSDPSSIEGIGQAIWAWDGGKEVTEIVDNYTNMTIDNSGGLYSNWGNGIKLLFPNLLKLTFTKSGVLDNRGSNRFFLRYIPVEELSIPFTDVIMNDSGAAIIVDAANLKTLKFPNLTTTSNSVYGRIVQNCNALTSLEMPEYVGATNKYGSIFLRYCSAIETLYLPKFKYYRVYNSNIANNCSGLKYVIFPVLEFFNDMGNNNPLFNNCPNLVEVTLGTLTSITRISNISNVALTYLEKVEVGQDTQVMFSLSTWTAANVSDDALLNTNIATYLAGRLYDYTGGTAHSITISTALYNRLTQATKDIFTNKNWTIVTA